MIMKAIIKQKRPIASHRANPRIAYVKSWPLREGFLAKPIAKLPKTLPIPAPEMNDSNVVKFYFINPLRDDKILDLSDLKQIAGDILKFT